MHVIIGRGFPVGEDPVPGNGYIQVREEYSSGTGVSQAAGAWRTRALNTLVHNVGAYASLTANQITLKPGTYEFTAYATGFQVTSHKAKLINTTANIEYIGSTEYNAAASSVSTRSEVSGKFTILVDSVFELQHFLSSSNGTNSMGVAAGYSVVEVYAEVKIRRLVE